jgi:molybdopterin/thiamine biosynthesis adenylyltransferase
VQSNEPRILIAGATGAGAAAAGHLAAGGMPYLAVADASRAESLAAKLGLLSPDVHADPYPVAIDEANAVAIATGHDVVVDATGDRQTGLLITRACAELDVPLVHVSQRGARGIVLVTRPGRTACLSCASGRADAILSGTSAIEPPLAGALAGMLGGAVAAEVVTLLGEEGPQSAVLRIAELPPAVHAESVERDPACEVCGTGAPAMAAPVAETAP